MIRWSEDITGYQREYCRRKSKAKYDAQRATSKTCPYRNCGCHLVFSLDGFGRVVTRCPWCERREAGICRGCPKKIAGKKFSAIWCEECRKQARKDAVIRYQTQNRERVRECQRATKRRWREKHPEESRRRVKEYQLKHNRWKRIKEREWRAKNREWWWPKRVKYDRRYRRLLRKLGVPNLRTARELGLLKSEAA